MGTPEHTHRHTNAVRSVDLAPRLPTTGIGSILNDIYLPGKLPPEFQRLLDQIR